MKKIPSIIIITALLISMGIVFMGGNDEVDETSQQVSNVEVKDGIQYITINARGGYSPNISNGKSGIPTKIIVKTNGTYDCSAALIIRSVGFQKILQQTGEELIDIGIPESGVPLVGTCSMGMYNFEINFS